MRELSKHIKKYKKLHFTTLSYTIYYTLHLKLFECMFCQFVILCIPTLSLVLTWMKIQNLECKV